jgi:hypothetical protein
LSSKILYENGGSRSNLYHFGERTTWLTPKAVSAVPAKVMAVIGSSNNNHAMIAVEGGTKYIKLLTEAAAPR